MEVKGVTELLGSTELGGVAELGGGPELRVRSRGGWRSGVEVEVRRSRVTVYSIGFRTWLKLS